MKKTQISIGKSKSRKIKARVKEIGTTSSGEVLKFEKQFNEMREKLKKLIKIADKKTGKASNHWEIGNLILSFEKYADNSGFNYLCNTKPLVEYVGKSEGYWQLHKKFAKTYLNKEEVNARIPWRMYLVLIREHNKEKRKRYEQMIIDGKIKNQQELWGLIKNKMNPSHKKVHDVLKKKDMTQDEIAEETGLSGDGVRGRITELRHRFGCNIKIVDGRYHLDE